MLLLAFGFFFFSCHDDATPIHQEEVAIDLSNLNIKLDQLDFSKPQLLFTYKNASDLTEKMQASNKEIAQEIDQLMQSKKDITNIVYNIKFSKGSAILTDFSLLDAKNKIVLNDRQKDISDIDWDGIMNGAACPDGWTNQGSCASADCVSQTTEEILTGDGGINSSGDCVTVRYNRGLFGVRICSSGC